MHVREATCELGASGHKVDDLDSCLTLIGEQDIFRLEIAVDDFDFSQVQQTL